MLGQRLWPVTLMTPLVTTFAEASPVGFDHHSGQGGSSDPTGVRAIEYPRASRLALARLENDADYYLQMAVAPSTAWSYSSAQQRYQQLCVQFSLRPLPATEQVLILFVAELAQSVCHATIRSYLSAVRNRHTVRASHPDLLAGSIRLELVLRGVRGVKARPGKMKLPVTPLILLHIREVLLGGCEKEDARMLWVACCLAFFLPHGGSGVHCEKCRRL